MTNVRTPSSSSHGRAGRRALLHATAAALAVAALALAIVLVGPGRKAFVAVLDARHAAAKLRALGPDTDPEDVISALDELTDSLASARDELRAARAERLADALTRSATSPYFAVLRRDLALPGQQRLAAEIAGGGDYVEQRNNLAAYLMLGTPSLIDRRAEPALAHLWVDLVRRRSFLPPNALEKRISRHVARYVEALKSGREPPLPIDRALEADTRASLARTAPLDRLRNYLVDSIPHERHDPYGLRSRANRRFPDQDLASIFADRVEVPRVFASRRALAGGARPVIGGAFTFLGYLEVLRRMMLAEADIEANGWVVPPTSEERGARLQANMRQIHAEYVNRMVEEWTTFLTDIVVKQPASADEARTIYKTLTRSEWPYLRLIQTVGDLAEWPRWSLRSRGSPCGPPAPPRPGDREEDTQRRHAVSHWRCTSGDPAPPLAMFGGLLRFGALSTPTPESPLRRSVFRIDDVLQELIRSYALPPSEGQRRVRDAMNDARKATEAELDSYDEVTRRILGPLLLDPLRFDISR